MDINIDEDFITYDGEWEDSSFPLEQIKIIIEEKLKPFEGQIVNFKNIYHIKKIINDIIDKSDLKEKFEIVFSEDQLTTGKFNFDIYEKYIPHRYADNINWEFTITFDDL
jgi:hypothetical protein